MEVGDRLALNRPATTEVKVAGLEPRHRNLRSERPSLDWMPERRSWMSTTIGQTGVMLSAHVCARIAAEC